MTLVQAFNDWGGIITATPIYLPFVAGALYFFFYPLIERFVII